MIDCKIVKTYEDACIYLGVEKRNFDGYEKDEIAYIKLKTIAMALRGGIDIKIAKQCANNFYFPWFTSYKEETISSATKEERKYIIDFTENKESYPKFGYVCNSVRPCADMLINYRGCLSVLSDDICTYFGKQFIDLWRDYLTSGIKNEQ